MLVADTFRFAPEPPPWNRARLRKFLKNEGDSAQERMYALARVFPVFFPCDLVYDEVKVPDVHLHEIYSI